MQTRKIGNLEVSALGLGCMGMSFVDGPRPNRREMIATTGDRYPAESMKRVGL